MLIKIVMVCLVLGHFCVGQPRFPCCAGSQQLTTFMAAYIVNFANSIDNEADKGKLCERVINDVNGMKTELEALNRCPAGGGARIFDEIDAQLLNTTFWHLTLDGCAYAFSFVRAMFNLATTATGHLKSTKWGTMKQNFINQIELLDKVCTKFGIGLNKNVQFSEPYRENDCHFEAPEPDELFNRPASSAPGEHSAFTEPAPKKFVDGQNEETDKNHLGFDFMYINI